jgi:hypothetical protein
MNASLRALAFWKPDEALVEDGRGGAPNLLELAEFGE